MKWTFHRLNVFNWKQILEVSLIGYEMGLDCAYMDGHLEILKKLHRVEIEAEI